jgi:hypothetical protein
MRLRIPPAYPNLNAARAGSREQHEQNEALLNAVLPSRQLQIRQAANHLELLPELGAQRGFDIGVTSTLVTRYATLHVESGWQGNEFVIHSRDSEREINMIERYQRFGATLRWQLQLRIPDAKQQLFTATYQLLP